MTRSFANQPDRPRLPGFLRPVAGIALWIGLAGSVGLFLYAGHRVAAPPLLTVLFAGWVATPFVILAAGYFVAPRWATRTQAALYALTPIITIASLAIYGAAAFGASRPKTAIFVMVAPVSWLFIAIVAAMAALVSARR